MEEGGGRGGVEVSRPMVETRALRAVTGAVTGEMSAEGLHTGHPAPRGRPGAGGQGGLTLQRARTKLL